MARLTDIMEDRAQRANYFDRFDEDAAPALQQGEGWQPTLRERFIQNFEAAKRSSPLGAAAEAGAARIGSPEENAATRSRQDQAALDYAQMAPSHSLLDYIAATGGQFAAGAMDPTSYIAAPLKIAGPLGRVLGPTAARIVERGAETAVANAGLDAASQAVRIADDRQARFDAREAAASAGIGAVLGGAVGALPAGRAVDDTAAELSIAPEPARAATSPEARGATLDRPSAAEPVQAPESAEAAPASPPLETRTSEDIRQQYTTNGTLDDAAAAEGIRADVGQAIAEGRTVTAHVDGSPLEIVGASDRALIDIEGRQIDPAALMDSADPASPALSFSHAASSPDIADRFAPTMAVVKQARPDEGVASIGSAGVGEAPRLETVIERLIDAAPDATPLRQGRMAPLRRGKKLGQYDLRQGVVRVGDVSDLETVTHEIGHAFETKWKEVNPLKQAHAAELMPLAYDGTPPGRELSEGFAEFLRYYVANPAFAEAKAPGFMAAFEKFLATKAPDSLAALRDAREGYRQWLAAPSGGAVKADIVSERSKGFLGRINEEIQKHGFRNAAGMWLDDVYTKAIDRLHPIDMAVNQLLKIHEANKGARLALKTADNPYRLQRLAVDASQGGMIDLMRGVVPYRGIDPVGPSMFDALQLALGPRSLTKWDEDAVDEFAAYLVARRAIAEFDRFEAGEIPNPPGKLTRGDYETARAELEAANPDWPQAAEMLYAFQNKMLEKKHAAGFLTDEQLETFLAKVDYVPFQRDMRDFGEEVGTGTGAPLATPKGTNKASIVKRFKGSNRSVINPLETIMRDAIETANIIARNDTFLALERLATAAGPGGGAIVERIRPTEIKRTEVGVTEAIEAAARQNGLDPRDIQTLRDIVDSTLGEHVTASIYRAGEITERGEPIIWAWKNGRRTPLRLADGEFGRSLYAALTGATKEQSNWLLNLATLPATALRAGITTSPEFLIANFIRDQLSAWIVSGEKFVPFLSGAKGIADEVMGSEAARLYSQAGGISGGANVAALHSVRVERDVQALRKKGFLVERLTSLEGLFRIAEVSETGTRVALFKAGFERARKEGLSDYEALLEAAYTARDYIDFGRHGSRMIIARKLVPFFNAALQGLDKTARTTVAPFLKYRLGMAMTAEERRQIGVAAKAWGKIVIGLGSLGLAQSILYRDDPEYEEISDYLRATHWSLKLETGRWLMIPKPFELATVSNLLERTFEATYRNDPMAWERMLKGLAQVTVPPTAAPGIDIGYELATNYDFFRDRAIVPEELRGLEPSLQFNAWTSELGRKIGSALNVSPMYVDHAITGFAGSWGSQILNWSNQLREGAPPVAAEDAFITKRFIKDVSRGATSSNQFWDLIARSGGEWERVAQTYKEMRDNGTLGSPDEYLAGKPEGAKAYAVLNAEFKTDDKRLHPLRRAKDAVTAISKFRQEMTLDNVRSIGSDELLIFAPAVKGQVDDVLSRLSMIEARNALIASSVPGWRQKAYMDTAPVWNELRAASPEAFDEIEARYAKAKVYPELGVRKEWPIAEQRILTEGGAADLSDLTAEARAD